MITCFRAGPTTLGTLSTRQYARLVDEWVTAIGLDSREYSARSLRRINVSMIYKATGAAQVGTRRSEIMAAAALVINKW